MALTDIVSDVANEAGYTVDTSIILSVDTTTKQMLAICQRIIKEMALAYPWTKLYASGSITLVAGQATYALPAAFSYYHYETFWNQSTRWRVLGPMTPQRYAEVQGFGLTTTVYQEFQIRGVNNTEFFISPPPGTNMNGQTIIFEYIADRYVRPQQWITALIVAANAYIFNNGNYYQTTAGGTTGSSAPVHTSGTVSDGGVSWTYYNGAYTKFLADTDVPILSQRVLEQGMLERFAEIHTLTVSPRYLDQLHDEYSKDIPGKILYAGGSMGPIISARSGEVVFGNWI